jgi:general transcription factor 3C polypeptide 3 (transcription factor C subunit 4)
MEAIQVELSKRDYNKAFEIFKPIILRTPTPENWTLFNFIISKANNYRSQKNLITTLYLKYPSNLHLMVITGNYSLMNGFYRLALAEYLRAFKLAPEDPLISLLIGVSYLCITMNRKNLKRNLVVAQAFTFLFHYKELKKDENECNFNLGRAFQYLCINDLAHRHYEIVLNNKNDDRFKRETAFNLSLLYKNSGSIDLSRRVLRKYIKIV